MNIAKRLMLVATVPVLILVIGLLISLAVSHDKVSQLNNFSKGLLVFSTFFSGFAGIILSGRISQEFRRKLVALEKNFECFANHQELPPRADGTDEFARVDASFRRLIVEKKPSDESR
ncbi:MAG TPA: hypothetical protein EYN91_16000 [Candidatus Melainabacteria bacterium]|nr:hypothetical protein [Candidatus Melainabacteria bacterium]HIN63738.1 hypothetical protein [Candidatus Obscuribacterales bacterium]